MAIVRILQGAYGSRNGKGRVHPIFKGEQVKVSDREALRLVNLGVAEIIPGSPTTPPVAPQNGPDPDKLPQDTTAGKKPAEAASGGEDEASDGLSVAALERMAKADLEQMAQDLGIDISGAKNNHERAELIAAAEAEDGDIVR
ncbi:MAG: hypothetical protein K2O18_07130 [Oscillospiraceae bacterium]|nr:hypothetical protein [Oscillospiraceae bacterium]